MFHDLDRCTVFDHYDALKKWTRSGARKMITDI